MILAIATIAALIAFVGIGTACIINAVCWFIDCWEKFQH